MVCVPAKALFLYMAWVTGLGQASSSIASGTDLFCPECGYNLRGLRVSFVPSTGRRTNDRCLPLRVSRGRIAGHQLHRGVCEDGMGGYSASEPDRRVLAGGAEGVGWQGVHGPEHAPHRCSGGRAVADRGTERVDHSGHAAAGGPSRRAWPLTCFIRCIAGSRFGRCALAWRRPSVWDWV